MIKAILPPRGTDRWGSGDYGAPRRGRPHNGIDYACHPGAQILAVKAGTVTKIGYPYSSGIGAAGTEKPFRYVEVRDIAGFSARYFYVSPTVLPGDTVTEGQVIGTVQHLTARYAGITNHVHLEILDPNSEYINPEHYV